MTFVHPFLLGGLALIGIPIVLHLIMRQKPKHLLFPAVRFLLQQQRTNQRKLRLRHLLLLLLRMLLIAAICLALTRPKIFSERLNFSSERPVNAVLIFDTSYSMEYNAAEKTRLDEAKRRGLELLGDLPPGSRAAIVDTADPGGDWAPSLSMARERINALDLRPANYPVTTSLASAYGLLEKIEEETDSPDEAPLRFLYVFSDRTQACWNASELEHLQRLRERLPAPGVQALFVDVGIDNPATVALTALDLPKAVIASNERLLIRATVQATGPGCDTEVLCRIVDQEPVERKPVTLAAGQSKVISFERRDLPPGMHQAEISLATKGALPFANVRYATVEVQGPRQVLTVTDNVANARFWRLALEATKAFKCDVKSTADFFHLFPGDLMRYQAICLLDVAKPDREMWEKLNVYVRDGGGLAIIPGGEELDRLAYTRNDAAQALMPGRLIKVEAPEAKQPAVWSAATYKHPLMAPFGEWSKGETVDFLRPNMEPKVFRFWEVEPRLNNETYIIVSYADKKPALLERNLDRKTYRGRVLLFTTAFDNNHLDPRVIKEPWNTYLQTSFYLVLANKTVGYLAGDAEGGNFNYLCGQPIPVPLPTSPRFPTYTVQGPGLTPAEAIVPRAENQSELQITKAVMPGNYKVFGGDAKPMGAFSLNVPPDECQLNRVPAEQIEALFGPGSILPLEQTTTLRDALQNHWNQPLELLPYLMLLVLLVLAVENFLANKFYRWEPEENVQEKEP